jgi:hypothetical protein
MLSQPIPHRPTFIDLTGCQFRRWTVVTFVGNRRWLCRCVCGREKAVAGYDLRSGKSRSCGCLRTEQVVTRSTKHGQTGTPEHRAWVDLTRRCRDSSHRQYRDYGGRGIRVCNRWRYSCEAFVEDMGSRPSSKHSIHRIDNDGHYELSNCMWATQAEQNRNHRRNHIITFSGQTMCLSDWAEKVGLDRGCLNTRLNILKWSVEKALTTPPRPRRSRDGHEQLKFRGLAGLPSRFS